MILAQDAATGGALAGGGLLTIGVPILLLNFLPSFVAFSRHHTSAVLSPVSNVLLGWTFIGWVAALVCSMSANPRGVVPVQNVRYVSRAQPSAGPLEALATCPSC